MIKFKNKEKIELFKIIQEAFFVKPEVEGNFVLEKDADNSVVCKWTITGSFDLKSISSSLQKKLKDVLPQSSKDKAIFGVESVKLEPNAEDVYVVKSENTTFDLDPKFEIFNKEDREILSVLASRCVDYKLIKDELLKINNLETSDEVKFRFIPKDTLALRVFINSTNLYLGDIDVSNITDLTYAFSIYSNARVQENPRKDFSGIEKWDTSNVTKMLGVFAGCVNFNADISSWNTSKVTNMEVMFASCRKFNQDLSWMDVSNVESMKGMFYRCDIFDQDLSSWDTSKCKDMSYMFFKCKKFAHDISMWKTEALKNDENMFLECNLEESKKPRQPSTDFKRQYYEKYVGPNSKKYARASNWKKLGIAAAFIIIVVVFSIMNQGVPA